MTTYELKDRRRELEHAVAYFDKHHPAAPALVDLKSRLDEVLAEQADRARIAADA
jgi:hypothetical protein